MDSVVRMVEPQQAPPSCKRPTAETALGFFSDPALTLAPLKSSSQHETPSLSMGACYPKCMGSADDVLLPGVQATRDEALVSKMQTFDLEELGLSHTKLHTKQLKSIIVDYEDSDGEQPQLRDQAATCAPSACAPLTKPRHRFDVSSLKGKSVIFQQQETEPTSPESDEERCSTVHKLCMCEVKLHRSLESCWLVSSGQVYDVTGLVTAHPGGVRSILRKAGGPECAKDMKFHTKKARKMMEKCFIGKLQQCGDDVCADDSNCSIM